MALALDDRLRHAHDGVEALLDVLDEPARLLQPRVEAGGNASSTAVRALIKQLVSAEDPVKPLSDSQLSQMLEEQGIQVARRTVAKYREALKIAPANLRKAL